MMEAVRGGGVGLLVKLPSCRERNFSVEPQEDVVVRAETQCFEGSVNKVVSGSVIVTAQSE